MIKRSTLTFGSLLILCLQVFTQTITITPAAPVSFCTGDSVTLVAQVSGGGYGTDSYSFQVVPFHVEALVADTAVDTAFRQDNGVPVPNGNHDDTWAGPFPIGFQFCFLNQVYTQYYVGSNGWIGFSNPLNQGWTTFTPFTIPNTASDVPKNAIFSPYQDWYPTRDWSEFHEYNVFRHIITDPPNSKLVVYWNHCPMYNCEYSPMGAYPTGTFQIVLNEQNSIIENNITLKPACNAWQNNAATQGVHNGDGTLAYVAFNRNANSWTTTFESTRFVPSGVTWYRDIYPGGTIVGQGDTIVLKPAITTTYFAVINTCTNGMAVASKVITVNPRPVPTLTGNTDVCMNNTEKYKTEAGMTGYTWNIVHGTLVSGGANTDDSVMVRWDQVTAPYSVSVSYIDANGCSPVTPTAITITVHPFITPVITGVNSICAGAQTTFTTQAGNTNYLWTYAGATLISGGTTTDNTITLSWSSSGTYPVTVNYTGPGGCTSNPPTTKNILVNPYPVPIYTGPANACLNSTQTYSTDPGMSNYAWVVSAGGTLNIGQGTNTITVTWNILGSQSVVVNYTDTKGCPTNNPPIYPVTILSQPFPTITGNASICNGSTGNIYYTESGMTGYTWTLAPDGTITSGGLTDSIQVTWVTSGVKTVTVNYANAGGCTAAVPATFPVTVHPLPTPSVGGPASICEGTAGSVYSTQPGKSNYNWSVSAGGTLTGGGTTNDNTVTVTWNTAGAQTISVNYSNIFNCTALTPFVYPVTVHALPSPVITGPANVCKGTTGVVYSTQPGMTNYQWVVSAGGIITGGGNTSNSTVTVTWNTAGAQSVSVNYHDLNSCTAVLPAVFPVTVNDLPSPTLNGNNNLCAGSTGIVYSTEAVESNYTWSISAGGTLTGGGTTSDNTATVTWTTAGSQTISVNYNDANGCTATAPVVYPVTVHPLPSPTLTGTNSLCAGTSGTVYTTEAGKSNYTWNISAGGTLTGGGTTSDNTATVTWNTAGPQTVGINYTDANNCTAAAPFVYNVTVNPLPPVTITGSATVCAGTTGVVYSTQAGMTNYQWIVSAGGTITGGGNTSNSTVTVTWNTAGAQTVSVNYHDLNGCTATSPTVYNVTVNVLPVPTISGNNALCAGSAGIVYTTETGESNYIWSVSGGGTLTGGGTTSDNTATVTWNTAGPQTISVNYHDVNGCTATAPLVDNVTVYSLPVPTLTGSNSICAATSGNVYTTEAGKTNYTWNISGGGTLTGGGTTSDNTATVTWNTAGPQSVSVNYQDVHNCTAVAPVVENITVNALPVPVITGTAGLCAGTSGLVYSTQPGMTNYQWIVSAGGTITGGGNTSNSTVTVTWNTSGAQSVSINYTNSNGCTAQVPTVYPVTVYALPAPVITGPASACINSSGIYSTAAGMSNYTWTVSAGGLITFGGGTSSVTILWSSSGSKTVSVNYTDANGCTAAAPFSLPVTVNDLPVPLLNGLNQVCAGTTTTYSTNAGMTGYSWTYSAGGILVSGGSATDNVITINWTVAGLQQVTVNYVAGTGCTASPPTSLTVTVNPLPSPTITGTNILCAGTSGWVYTTQAGMSNYQWVVSAGGMVTGGGTTSSNTVTVTWNGSGAQSVTLNYTHTNGCMAASPVVYPVTVNPLPVPVITGPPSVCLSTLSTYATDAGMSGYTWSVSPDGLISGGSGSGNFTVSWSTSGIKTLNVFYTDLNGCTNSIPATYTVNVSNLPFPTLNGPANLCSGNTAVYITESGMSGYSWVVSAGGFITNGGSSTDATVTVQWNLPGTGTVSVNYQSGPGCSGSSPAIRSVNVAPRPTVTNAANSSVCSGTQLNLVLLADLQGTLFSWTATGSSAKVSGFFSGNGNNITDILVNTGLNTETVTYAVTPSLNGCDGNVANFVVSVFPVADVNFTPNGQTFCSGGWTNISLASNVNLTTFTWTATGSSGNVSGFSPGSGNNIHQPLINSGYVLETVTYHVTPSANGCSSSPSDVQVIVEPAPLVTFTPCTDIMTTTDAQPFLLKGGNPLGGTYSGAGVNAGIFNPSLAGAGVHTLTFSYTTGNGCSSSNSLNITVLNPQAFSCDNPVNDIRDNTQYPTVKIGAQCWMAANLNFGNTIPSSAMQRDNCIVEKYCFSNLAGNCLVSGGLYQWDEMMQFNSVEGSQGLCPPAWHVPTENDWTTLFNFYISNGMAASPLKSSGYSGFDALLNGMEFNNTKWKFDSFATFFWSSTPHGPYKAWAHSMNNPNPSVSYYPGNRSNAFSVRCIKD